jgi:hypothetical protein
VLFIPALLHDGQYILVFLLTVPIGAGLGAVTAYALVLHRRGERRNAGAISLAGGIVMALAHGPWLFGLPLSFLWAVGLIVAGVRMIRTHQRDV